MESVTYKHITVKIGDKVRFYYSKFDSIITEGVVERVEDAGDSGTTDPYAVSEWDTGFYLSGGRRFSLESIVDKNIKFEIVTTK